MATGRLPRVRPKTRVSTSAPDDKLALRVWLRLLSSTQMIERDIRTMLRKQFDTTLPRFDVLAALDASNGMLQMGELSERLMVTSGNVTGLVDLMEQDGLVERLPHPTDRRSTLIQMTARGEALFSDAMPEHQLWVQDIIEALSAQEMRQLYELLGKVKDSVSIKGAAEKAADRSKAIPPAESRRVPTK